MSFGKRLFDLVVASVGVLILLPLFLIVGIAIKIEDAGPVFYRQERVGYRGKHFRIWKFRTMVVDADKYGLLTVGQDSRITKVGYWLRKTKIDELPQLFNVIAGEMSLVGPRPEVPVYVALYNTDQKKVLDLVPGITDPASIRFKNENELLAEAADAEQIYILKILPAKITMNLEYGARAGLWSDLMVILETVWRLLV